MHSPLRITECDTWNYNSTVYVLFHVKSGFVTDEEVKQRESKLREALKNDKRFQVKRGVSVEVSQVRIMNEILHRKFSMHFFNLEVF